MPILASATGNADTAWLGRKKILVTGSTGLIGTHVLCILSKTGAEIHVTSRSNSLRPPNLHSWMLDLGDIDEVRRLVGEVKPDLIFHLAGAALGGRDRDLILPTFTSNLVSTVNLLLAATEVGVEKIILPGSLEEPDEMDEFPSSPYTASKWAAREYGLMFHGLYKTPVSVARISITYGPTSRNLHKIIPYVILTLLNGESPKLGSGEREVDWIHVDDVVEALLVLARSETAIGREVHVGSGQLVSIRKVVEILVQMINPSIRPQFGELPTRALEKPQFTVADVENTYNLVGWKPKISLEEGLKMTVEWFSQHQKELVNAWN